VSERDDQTVDEREKQAEGQHEDRSGDQSEDRAGDLGPMPEPQIEPGEPAPGGVDAVGEGPHPGPATPDLSLDDNPAVDHVALPDEMKSGEDTSTQATRSEEPMAGEQESPA
jgi:hypothetical protein